MAKRGNRETGGTTRRDFMRRAAIAGLGAGAAMTSGLSAIRPAAAAKIEGPLNLFTWGGHIEKSEFDDFFKETGVRVNFTGAAGNAEDLAKLKLGGGSQYDIVGVGSGFRSSTRKARVTPSAWELRSRTNARIAASSR